jgi:tyrosine-protein phosphatase SIW14
MLRKSTFLLVVTTVLATTVLVAACSSTATPPRPVPPDFATLLPDADGLAHVARITPNLYRGAQPTALGYRTLEKMGVKTVICLRRFHSSRTDAEAAGLHYVAIPIYASIGSEPPSDAQVRQFFATVLDPAKLPVYFHCQHGKDRTGLMAALYRIERQGWTPTKAMAEMRALGYHDIFRDLIRFAHDYEPRGFQPPATSRR